MSNNDSLVFKVASESWEFEQIHELNYQTFVHEIPQHQQNETKKLVDKYHQENTYVICLRDAELLGMIALRDKRPLSLDDKLADLESYLPPFKRILEYRLLAVKKQHRNTAIFTGIMKKSFDLAISGEYDVAVISGTTHQARLYKHLGFKSFGPLVGKQDALYQPMYIDVGGAIELKKQSQILQPKKGSEMEHDQAIRAGLDFEVIHADEGMTFSRETLQQAISQHENLSWLWTVHCETSTGVLNDVAMLREVCKQHNLKLCLDGISSIGSCDVDLQDVYLATAVSGKGIGSLPGLAMVFCDENVLSGDRQIPRYFDLAFYEARQGIPFTISSNAIYALYAALINSDWTTRFANIKQWSEELLTEFEELGLQILADKSCRAPHVTTIVLPETIKSLDLGELLESEGVLVSYRSEYLMAKNYIQICFMGECQKPPRMITYFLREALKQATQDIEVA